MSQAHFENESSTAPVDGSSGEGKNNENKRAWIVFGTLFSITIIVLLISFLTEGGGLRAVYNEKVRIKRNLDDAKKTAPPEGSLIRTLAEANTDVVDEIGKIKEEGGLPEQIFQRSVPAPNNVASQIYKEFESFSPETYEKLRENISRGESWGVDVQKVENFRSLLDMYSHQRDRIREMLDHDKVKFEQELVRTPVGMEVDGENIDRIWVYLTLEEIEIGFALEEGDMDRALRSLQYMLRLSELAAGGRFLTMRIQAAYMRENSLRVLQTLATDPGFEKEHARTMITVLRNQLQNWPPDSKCWIGDRAESLRVYELLRKGRITEALMPEEIEELLRLNVLGLNLPPEEKEKKPTSNKRLQNKKKASGSDSLLGRVAFYSSKDYDRDEQQYLRLMRILINSCSNPFYTRLEALNRIDDYLNMLRGSPDYLPIATILLRGVRDGMQIQALDKARLNAWFLASAASLELPYKEGALDPVRGKPYEITRARIESQLRIIVLFSGGLKVEMKDFSDVSSR